MTKSARKVVTETPLNAAATNDALTHPITPNGAFFTRSHYPAPVADGFWRVEVAGEVIAPRSWTLDEITALPKKDLIVTVECAGNGRTLFDPKPGGTPWERGAVSTARFGGTPLVALLEDARVAAEAEEILFVGGDVDETKDGEPERYARSLPLDVAHHPDTLLVWEMNGEPLPVEHGHPLRLIVPGWYGMASVKWLAEIRAIDRPFDGFYQVEDYVFKGREGVPDGTPLSRMAVNSMVLRPDEGEAPSAEIVGIAWSGHGAIARVELTTDDGDSWIEAELSASTSPYAHQSWRAVLATPPKRIAARATDEAGNVQPRQAPWNELGYQNNGWHVVTLGRDDG